MEQVSTLTYRPYEEKDLAGVVKLWSEHSGWGAINEVQYRQWCRTPHGEALVMVAVDEEDVVVGQCVFFPCRMVVDGQPAKGVRLLAPIVHSNFRHADLRKPSHPVISLYRSGFQEVARRGYPICYSFPAYGWIALIRKFPHFGLPKVEIATYDCKAISLQAPLPPLAQKTIAEVQLVSGFSEEYHQLWKDAVQDFPVSCGLERDPGRLNWKWSSDFMLEVRNKKEQSLTGYAVIKKDSGLLVDALARTEKGLKEVIQAVFNAIHHNNPNRLNLPFDAIKFMDSPLMASATEGFVSNAVDYKFAFGCLFTNGHSNNQPIEASKWYMMPDV